MAGLTRGDRVFVDTNVIIEACRLKCFKAVVEAFSIEATGECVAEAATGDFTRPGYVAVDTQVLRERVVVHQVTRKQMATAALRSMRFRHIDRGEQELLAAALNASGALFVSTADKATIYAAHELGFIDRTISLEEVASFVGMNCAFKGHYTRKFLSTLRTTIQLEEF